MGFACPDGRKFAMFAMAVPGKKVAPRRLHALQHEQMPFELVLKGYSPYCCA